MNTLLLLAFVLLLLVSAALTWAAAKSIAERDRARAARDAEHALREDLQRQLGERQDRYTRLYEEKLALENSLQEAQLRAESCAKSHAREIQRLQEAGRPRPARLQLEEQMTPEQLADLLRGTAGLPAVRAVLALVKAQIVELCDRSTDAPRETIALPDRTLAPYTAEMRLHDAGGAFSLAELLSRLQELTAAKEPLPAEQQQAA